MNNISLCVFTIGGISLLFCWCIFNASTITNFNYFLVTVVVIIYLLESIFYISLYVDTIAKKDFYKYL